MEAVPEPDPLTKVLMTPGADPVAVLERLAGMRPAWHRHAACRGMGNETFFPERYGDHRPAKAICAGCPVTVQCELSARAGGDAGIWGGTSARERRKARSRAA